MSGGLRVLVVEDDDDDARLLERELRRGWSDLVVVRVETRAAMEEALASSGCDIVISDYSLPGFGAPAALEAVHRSGRDVPFIIVSGTVGEETAVAVMKAGAHDYLLKGALTRLVPAVERELREADSRRRRREAEEALRESEERYRSFFEEDITSDFITTVEGTIIDCNPAFLRTFGFADADEARGASIVGIYPDPSQRVRFLETLRREREMIGFEQELRDLNGMPVHVVQNAVGIFDEAGELVRIKGYLFDVTAHKATEEQLRQAQKMEAVGRLAGGVAHDFNNILQVMTGIVELLRMDSGDTGAVSESAEDLSELIRRSAALTRQLLLFARRDVARHGPIDLDHVVRNATGLLTRLVRANVHFSIATSPGPLPVRGDAGQLEQVLMNLVVNAVDAMPDGGRLEVRTGRSPEAVWFEVNDTGPGIPDAIRDKVFEPFFTTKEVGKGTGLGLSVVHGIVSHHGGSIRLANRPGGGATARVELPVGAEADRTCGTDPAAAERRGRGERILVVDDDPLVSRRLKEMLSWLGYEVVVIGNVDQVHDLGAVSTLDLLVTDFMLPGGSGFDVLSRLRERWPELPVIVMSGYAEDEILRKDVDAGRVRFLQKPFDLEALASEVCAALDQG